MGWCERWSTLGHPRLPHSSGIHLCAHIITRIAYSMPPVMLSGCEARAYAQLLATHIFLANHTLIPMLPQLSVAAFSSFHVLPYIICDLPVLPAQLPPNCGFTLQTLVFTLQAEPTWNQPGTNLEPPGLTWNQPGSNLEPTWNHLAAPVLPAQLPPNCGFTLHPGLVAKVPRRSRHKNIYYI